MNIQPLKSEAVPVAAKSKVPQTKTPQKAEVQDTIKPGPSEKLLEALRGEPLMRIESLERGRALVADTNYPPPDVLEKLAELFQKDAQKLDAQQRQ